MRVLFDAHALGSRLTGNETYARNLLRALLPLDAETEIVALLRRDLDPGLAPSAARNLTARKVLSGSRLRRLAVEIPAALGRERPDLLHVQAIAPLRRTAVPLVVTLHDLSFERHPEWFPLRERLGFRWLIPRSARRAAIVLAPSTFTRHEAVELYGLAPERVVVTPEGVAPEFFPRPHEAAASVKGRLGLPARFVLSLGTLQPRKNLPRLIRAFRQARRRIGYEGSLVLAGPAGYRSETVRAAAAAEGGGADVLFAGYLPTNDAAALLSDADAFAYPSLYEGFGLPVVEAMACGAPVVTSSTTSLPEAAGGAALLVPPEDETALAAALERVLTEPELVARLRRLGAERAARASWSETARLTLAAYRRAAER